MMPENPIELERAAELAAANAKLQLVLWLCIGILAAIVCVRYALRWLHCSRAKKRREAIRAEAARRARVAQTELCRQRIKFLHGRTIYLPGNTAPSGRSVNGIRREKAALN